MLLSKKLIWDLVKWPKVIPYNGVLSKQIDGNKNEID
jgi:hypothetical protein